MESNIYCQTLHASNYPSLQDSQNEQYLCLSPWDNDQTLAVHRIALAAPMCSAVAMRVFQFYAHGANNVCTLMKTTLASLNSTV